MRRVVTGHDASGKSVVLSDAPPPVVREIPEDGAAFYEIWSTDESPAPVAPDEPDPTERQLGEPLGRGGAGGVRARRAICSA
jgi:hypothetical protein